MAHDTLPLSQSRIVARAASVERTFSRTSWAVLLLALLLLGLSCAQKAYRLTLPTDGWQVAIGAPNLTYERNMLGLPTPLGVGDQIEAIDGHDVTNAESRAVIEAFPQPANWIAGHTVRYTVVRNGQRVDLSVPLHHWTLGALARSAFEQFILGAALPSLLLALFVFLKRPRNGSAQLLLLLGAAGCATAISWIGTPGGISEIFASHSVVLFYLFWSHLIHAFVLAPLSLAAVVSIALPALFSRYWQLIALVLGGVPFVLLTLLVARVNAPFFAWVLVCYALEVGVLVYAAITVHEPIRQKQVRWLALGEVISTALGVPAILAAIGLAIPFWLQWIGMVPSSLFWVAALAIAILRYRLFEIDVILSRALVYSILTAFVIGTYIFVVAYLGALFRADGTLWPSLVATGIVAILFQPLRERVQRIVNRMLYGQRDEPYAVLSHLGERLEATFAPDAALPTIVETIRDALKLPYVAITLKQEHTFLVVAASGDPHHATVAWPLTYQHELVGQLLLTPRATDETFGRADRRLLDDLARQAGVVVHAVVLTRDLQHANSDLQVSRERLIALREEERRRIRRDLHDGLGPALASLTFKVDAARNLLRRDLERADILLASVTEMAQNAIVDIRRLVYDLRPPVLDQLGLMGAIRELVVQHQGRAIAITVDPPSNLPSFPAAVEVAAYRIVQEALLNVVKHAHAQTCTIRLTVNQGALIIEVADDGSGLPPQYSPGVGLHAIRERAEELGGVCMIGRAGLGGMLVRAELPLGAH